MPLQIVVPMAGDGVRFRDAGYEIPKPLLPVGGVPMVVRTVHDLPAAERVVLLVRRDHIDEHAIDHQIRRYLPNARIVEVESLTAGQAATVRLAADELVRDWPVIVASCDNTHVYAPSTHAKLMAQAELEALVWTYRGHPGVAIAPKQYGYVRVDGNRAVEVRCKQVVSENPMKDHMVTGTFTFRNAGRMIDAIDQLIARAQKVVGEYYMDVVPNLLIEDGYRVEVFEVEDYVGWGTPNDYETFCSRGKRN
jgi:NDP-sugar pyrophosphorylase family protein